MSPSTIDSHLAGIDFTQPVKVVNVPGGTQLTQWNFPPEVGQYVPSNIGNYFTDLGVGPDGLGIYTNGRVEMVFEFDGDVMALRSTAAAMTDTWSVYGWAIDAAGGNIQYFVAFF